MGQVVNLQAEVSSQRTSPGAIKYFTLQYEVNDACNLRCSHCYHGLKVIKASSITLERLFSDLEGLHQILGPDYRILIRLSGGEVFLRKDLMQILLELLRKDYLTILLTNGTLVTPDNAFEVMVHQVLLTQISLDGPTAEIHDAIRGRGQFQKALEGLRHFRDNHLPVSLSYTLMSGHNDKAEDFQALFELAKAESVDLVNFSRIFPQGDAHHVPEYAYTNGAYFKTVLETLLDTAERFPELNISIKDPLVKNLERHFPSHVNLDVCCFIKQDYLAVSANGDVYACRKLDKTLGNLHETTLAEIWQHSELLEQMDQRRIYMQGKCQTCPIRFQCRGGCLAASYGLKGELFHPDPACWREELPV